MIYAKYDLSQGNSNREPTSLPVAPHKVMVVGAVPNPLPLSPFEHFSKGLLCSVMLH